MITAGGGEQQQISRKMVEDAAADSRYLMEHSPVLPKLVAVDIFSRQLFLLIRQGIEDEVKRQWEVEEPDLVIQTLGMSAQECAVATRISPTALRTALLETVLPVIDIFCLGEEDNARNNSDPDPAPDIAATSGETAAPDAVSGGESRPPD